MLLHACTFDIHGFVQEVLCMGSSHVRTSSPLCLDRIPCFSRSSSCHDSKGGNIGTVKSNMPPRQLVTEIPFVKRW